MRVVLNKLNILIIHLVVAFFLSYLAYMIINKKQIPVFVGLFIGVLALVLVAAQSYLYFYKSKKRKERRDALRGFHFPDDGTYDPIGGRPGGITWV